MRPYQIFAAMDAEAAQRFFGGLSEGAPGMFSQLLHAAAAAMKSRPAYVKKLSLDKQCSAMRRALARVGANALAEEMLAVYFLECRKELLVEWLDLAGLAHDEGTLEEDEPTQPAEEKLLAAVQVLVGIANVLLAIPVEVTGLHSALAAALVLTIGATTRAAWLGPEPAI